MPLPRASIPAVRLAAFLLALVAVDVAACGGPVQVVAPYAPGGAAGSVAEVLSEALGPLLARPVTLAFRPGNGGAEATRQAAASTDPCLLLVGTVSTQVLLPLLHRSHGYDPLGSFAPVALVAAAPLVLAVRTTLPARSVGDLIAHGRAHGLRVGSGEPGTVSHVAAAMFARQTGVRVQHVPHAGGSAALGEDLAAARIDAAFDNGIAPLVHQGRVRALAVTSRTRLEALPGVPTVAEAGVPGYDATTWVGLYATRAAPPDFVATVAAAVGRATHDPAVRAALAARGMQPRFLGPAAFATFMQAEVQRWSREVQPGARR